MKKLLILITLLFSLVVTSANAIAEVNIESKVTGLYVAYFDRAGDQQGVNWWKGLAEQAEAEGKSASIVLKDLSLKFSQHPSFARAYGDMNNQQFVEAIYKNTLGREGDVEGVNYWTGRLTLQEDDASYLSRSDFVSLFVEAALTFDRTDPQYAGLSEEVLDAAQLRKDLISNKVTVALAFTHQLGILSNVLDPNNPESDPAYLASIKIISEVTEDHGTMERVLIFLESIIGSDDPVADILKWGEDTTAPVITLTGAVSVTVTRGTSYSEAGASASDDVDGSVTVTISGSVDTMSVGNYTVTYRATDAAGNTATATRSVTVEHDSVAPVITLNGAVTVTLSVGDTYTEAGAIATDNVDGICTVSISGSVDTSTAATYTITYRATDLDGNEGTETRTVVVQPSLSEEEEGLNYLNSIRAQMSLRPFVFSVELNVAAKAHSDYLDANNILSHYEDSSNAQFYEEWPLDRVVKAQYAARYVSENASSGQMDVRSAIDGLFTAIYHRFGFINPKWDEIGIGVTWTKYVFDMGNSGIRSICQETQEERDAATEGKSTYRTICLDTDKWIAVDEYENAINLSPTQLYFVYPPVEATGILPVFMNETPNPLPYKSYSGNPISVTFDSEVVACDEISRQSFTLRDDNLSFSVDIYVNMDKDNDPNSIFTSCDFAIFPTERLEYNHHYTASFVYSDGNGNHTISWGYSTVNPGIVLKTVDTDEAFDIVSGETYYVYIPPTDTDPTIGSVGWSYSSSMNVEEFLFYDSSTLKIRVSGSIGDTMTITYQSDKKVILTLIE